MIIENSFHLNLDLKEDADGGFDRIRLQGARRRPLASRGVLQHTVLQSLPEPFELRTQRASYRT